MTKCDIDPPHSQDSRSTLQWVEIPMFGGPTAVSSFGQSAVYRSQRPNVSTIASIVSALAFALQAGVVAMTEFSM
jgi:hypothetical protein